MKLVLAVAAALTLLLFFAPLQAAYTSDQVQSEQTILRAKGSPGPVGNKLNVYLSGDRTLARQLQAQLAAALRAKDLPFAEVRFLNEIPPDSNENPFLAIHLAENRGLWTPVFATRHLQATLLYASGRPVNRDQVLAPAPEGVSVNFTAGTCTGECSAGQRTLKLNAIARGLVSLPHLRAYTAGKLAQEAAILVADGLPEHLNPANWSARASTLAREKLGTQQSGISTFQRLTGCSGGVVVMGDLGGGDWSLMYYDAVRDAITEVLARSEVQAKQPGVQFMGFPGLGTGENGLSVFLGGHASLTIPAGTCSLAGWRS